MSFGFEAFIVQSIAKFTSSVQGVFTRYHISFDLGTIKAEKAVNTQ